MRRYAVIDLLSRASFWLEQAPMTRSFAGVQQYLGCFKSFLQEVEETLLMPQPYPYQFPRAVSTNSLASDY